MNWKYYVGASLSRATDFLLSQSAFPLTRAVPHGWSWPFDASRYAGTRNFDIILDAGANVGQTASRLIQYFPKTHIYSFEPVERTYAQLRENIGLHSNVTCVNKALGAQTGKETVLLQEDSELNTLSDAPPREPEAVMGKEVVSIDTVDNFCDRNNIRHVDILKMDVQGYELNILEGATDLINENRVRLIYSEVSFSESNSDMQSFCELNQWLHERGYQLCGFYKGFRYGNCKQYLLFLNALYINTNF
ncbi:FkbM family methyltransferase [Salinibacter ruber]|uniref:FkbM family methyltransferase n=1 Tax=Salinibacter ruber TaxID=146919 RepID=UPI001614B310|nr:FkbM family methyltransferase [Salinibacter ruber]MBB4070349.1 FkbM family methyltransferase [Salinibacter ruber]